MTLRAVGGRARHRVADDRQAVTCRGATSTRPPTAVLCAAALGRATADLIGGDVAPARVDGLAGRAARALTVALPMLPRELHTTDRPSSTAQWTTLGRALELGRAPSRAHRHRRVRTGVPVRRPAARCSAPLTVAGPLVRLAERLELAGLAASGLCRHAFIDEHLLRRCAPAPNRCWSSARATTAGAYRFAAELGGRPVYEVDLPPLSRRKAAIVAAASGPVRPRRDPPRRDRLPHAVAGRPARRRRLRRAARRPSSCGRA